MNATDWDVDELAIANADSYIELTAQLYAIRKRRGLSQKQVAQAMGTSAPAVSRLESGHGNPTIRTLQDYAEAIGAHLSFVAVPEHNTGEWQDQSRRVTEEIRRSFFVQTCSHGEEAKTPGNGGAAATVTESFAPTRWTRAEEVGV